MAERDPYQPDRVASIRTDWSWNRRDRKASPSPEDVARYLPANYRLGDSQSWRILVRGQDKPGGASLEDVIQMLAGGGIEAAEVEREGIEAVYQFRTRRDGGSGSFGSPPGDATLNYSIYGYHSSGGKGRPNTHRSSGPDAIMSIESLAEDEGGYYPKADVRRAKRIIAEAAAQRTGPSEEWVRHTYGYFAHSYSPDGVDRNVSNAISASKLHCRCGENFWNRAGLDRHIERNSGPRGGYRGHGEVAKPLPPPEHHLGYLAVRKYYPDHQPRFDLIAHPEGLYGSRECRKCHERVQYEARSDSWAKVRITAGGLHGGTDPNCPAGGQHETVPPEGEEARIRMRANCHARDGELHATFCSAEGCDCRHYRWSGSKDDSCTCTHSKVGSHSWRPNCDGTFDAETEARLAAEREAECCENCAGSE